MFTLHIALRPFARRIARVSLVASVGFLIAACHRGSSPLLASNPPRLDAMAPDSFVVRFETTRGDFDLKVHRDWSPRGSDRLHWLISHGFYDRARFFRVVPGFIVQFGISADTAVARAWKPHRITDDPVARSNVRGTLSFATSGPNTRTVQLFINTNDNARLDQRGFSPLAQVIAGMPVVDSLYSGYGEGAPRGSGPSQELIEREGDAYLARNFPKLDQILRARMMQVYSARR
ncbi:MAG: peptidylprolyl isomerase [Gemmatimonadaceae bacterium]